MKKFFKFMITMIIIVTVVFGFIKFGIAYAEYSDRQAEMNAAKAALSEANRAAAKEDIH